MDNIKILAAVFALAGCMENGMGMEIHNSNEIFKDHIDNKGYLVVTPENIDQIAEHKMLYNGKSLKFYDIDFTGYSSTVHSVCYIMRYMYNIEFDKCKFDEDSVLGGFPDCSSARKITFLNCTGIDQTDEVTVLNVTYLCNCLNNIKMINCKK